MTNQNNNICNLGLKSSVVESIRIRSDAKLFTESVSIVKDPDTTWYIKNKIPKNSVKWKCVRPNISNSLRQTQKKAKNSWCQICRIRNRNRIRIRNDLKCLIRLRKLLLSDQPKVITYFRINDTALKECNKAQTFSWDCVVELLQRRLRFQIRIGFSADPDPSF